MYYPYLRGHKCELSGLCELAPEIAKSEAVIPIIEPVDADSQTVNSLKEFKEARMPFILVTNPTGLKAGEFLGEFHNSIISGGTCCKIGMIITGQTVLSKVEEFIKTFKKWELCLIHFGNFQDPKGLMSLIAKTPAVRTQVFVEERVSKRYLLEVDMNTRTVVISDPIGSSSRNSKTGKSEFFSRSHALYIQSGFDGFGDFLLSGDPDQELYKDAEEVVHFTYYKKKTDEIWVRHFAMDVNGNSSKFLKIIEFIERMPAYTRTESLQRLPALHRAGCCLDGETLRKVLLKHHIELMIKCIGKKLHQAYM